MADIDPLDREAVTVPGAGSIPVVSVAQAKTIRDGAAAAGYWLGYEHGHLAGKAKTSEMGTPEEGQGGEAGLAPAVGCTETPDLGTGVAAPATGPATPTPTATDPMDRASFGIMDSLIFDPGARAIWLETAKRIRDDAVEEVLATVLGDRSDTTPGAEAVARIINWAWQMSRTAQDGREPGEVAVAAMKAPANHEAFWLLIGEIAEQEREGR
jgi:hypothetical protein